MWVSEVPRSFPGAGYGIVLGFGVGFSLITTLLVYLDKRFNGTNISSEFFNTARPFRESGLDAAVIVSQWTWAATLLQSSNVAYQYGVSGPFWYASGAHDPSAFVWYLGDSSERGMLERSHYL